MTKFNIETLDDVLQTESCLGFAGGQRSYGPPDRLSPVEAAELLNIDLAGGAAATRRGTARVGAALPGSVQGLAWFEITGSQYLVACSTGSLYRFDGSAWTAFSGYVSASATAPVCFAQLAEVLYIADGVSHLFTWDGSTLSDLGAGGAGEPPVANIVLAAGGRLWSAGASASPGTLYASRLGDGATWDATLLALPIDAGDGDPIVGLAELEGSQIVVFKRNSIYMVRADPASTSGVDAEHSLSRATVTKISDTIGCVARRTIARVGSDLWFLSDHGVYAIGRVAAQADRELKDAKSLPIHDLVQRIHADAAAGSSAFCWGNRYLLSVPLDGSTVADALLVYDVSQGVWAGLWTGWNVQCWALSRASGRERLCFGRPDGQVRQWLDFIPRDNEVESTFQDAGENIPTRLVTRAMTLGDPLAEKSALSVHCEFFASHARVGVEVALNEDQPLGLVAEATTDLGTITLPVNLPVQLPSAGVKRKSLGAQHLHSFRSLQVVLRSAAAKLSVRAIQVTGFVNSVCLDGDGAS